MKACATCNEPNTYLCNGECLDCRSKARRETVDRDATEASRLRAENAHLRAALEHMAETLEKTAETSKIARMWAFARQAEEWARSLRAVLEADTKK